MKKVALLICFSMLLVFLGFIPNALATGPAFSGITATADTAETIAGNPAGMTRLKKPSIYGNPMILYTNSETEMTVSGTGQKQTVSDNSVAAMPGLYYVKPLGDRWSIGIGPNAATGLGATYDDEWAGRYLLKEWSLTFVGVAPTVAYRVSDRFSVGVSVPIMYSSCTMEKAVYNLDPAAQDGDFELEADGWGVGGIIGLLYELNAQTRFGFVYRSKVSVTEEGKPEFTNLTSAREQLLNRFGALNQDISFDTSTPQAVLVGGFHDFSNGWSMSLDLAWIDFSEWGFEEVVIGDSEITTQPGNYKDIWGLTLGVNYDLTPKWTIQTGAFYLSSALNDEDRTAFTRFDQMWGAGLGCEYKFKPERSIAFNLTYLQFGDGEFTAQDVPQYGDIQGKYTTNYALVFGISTKW